MFRENDARWESVFFRPTRSSPGARSGGLLAGTGDMADMRK
jgi:hypothetical protein